MSFYTIDGNYLKNKKHRIIEGFHADDPVNIINPDDEIIGFPLDDIHTNHPVIKAIDGNKKTKYLNKEGNGSGFIIKPSVGSTIITGLRLISANNHTKYKSRSPEEVEIFGSNNSQHFQNNAAEPTEWKSIAKFHDENKINFTKNYETLDRFFDNTEVYNIYKFVVNKIQGEGSMQIAGVELLGIHHLDSHLPPHLHPEAEEERKTNIQNAEAVYIAAKKKVDELIKTQNIRELDTDATREYLLEMHQNIKECVDNGECDESLLQI